MLFSFVFAVDFFIKAASLSIQDTPTNRLHPMFELLGALVLIWFAISFVAAMFSLPANHTCTPQNCDDDRDYGWIKYVPLVQIVVLIINPDYGRK
jgi:hypothetical protein